LLTTSDGVDEDDGVDEEDAEDDDEVDEEGPTGRARMCGGPVRVCGYDLLLSVKTRRRAATGNTRSREASGTAGGPRSLGQRPSDLARALAESR
jgi:hypothetical protein